VATPVFMPVGTAGSIKGVTPDHVASAQTQMVLANTYHLMLRPGADVVAGLGGLHRMMAWDAPILTDSGGYQVFSLADRRQVTDAGVTLRSHIDGAAVELTAETCMAAQAQLGADVVMQLDECAPGDAARAAVAEAARRSADWAERCKAAWDAAGRSASVGHAQALFGIQQGGSDAVLRAESARRIVALDLPGYAVGGLSVGEGPERMAAVLEHVDAQLPRAKPRYLMGVGEPRDILVGVRAGIDMFDCVLPTRNGRAAQAFTWAGRLKLRNAAHARDDSPIDPDCSCHACRSFSRAAIRHYFMVEEMLGPILVTIHNLAFFAQFMSAIRQAIADGALDEAAAEWMARMY